MVPEMDMQIEQRGQQVEGLSMRPFLARLESHPLAISLHIAGPDSAVPGTT